MLKRATKYFISWHPSHRKYIPQPPDSYNTVPWSIWPLQEGTQDRKIAFSLLWFRRIMLTFVLCCCFLFENKSQHYSFESQKWKCNFRSCVLSLFNNTDVPTFSRNFIKRVFHIILQGYIGNNPKFTFLVSACPASWCAIRCFIDPLPLAMLVLILK